MLADSLLLHISPWFVAWMIQKFSLDRKGLYTSYNQDFLLKIVRNWAAPKWRMFK
jgi:hypothetical protein